MNREELLRPLTSSAEEVRAFEAWDALPGFIDGVHVCTALMKGSEIHFAIVAEHRLRTVLRSRTREFLAPLFERYGFLTTRVALGRKAEQRFVQRMGFEPTWADHKFEYYLLAELPFERKKNEV
jgi:hypothetical protein